MTGGLRQLMLFGQEPPPEVVANKWTATESLYWISNSALQKYIRRGLVDQALFCGRIMFEAKEPSLRRRLMVIMMEDVGVGDWPVVLEVGNDMASGAKKPWEAYESAIRKLALATKNRDADDGFNLVIDTRHEKWPAMRPLVVDRAEFDFFVGNAGYTDPGAEMSAWWNWAEDESLKLGRRLFERVRWLRPFQSRASWHANHLALITMARWDPEKDDLRPPLGVKEDESVTSFGHIDEDEKFPEFAVDWHTRHGKIVYGKLTKDHQLPKLELHYALFFGEGAKLNRWAYWSNDYRSVVVESYFPEGFSPGLQAALDNVNPLRRWAFKKLIWPAHLKECGESKKR